MIRPKLLIHTVLEKERERTTTDSKRLIGSRRAASVMAQPSHAIRFRIFGSGACYRNGPAARAPKLRCPFRTVDTAITKPHNTLTLLSLDAWL